jgi:NYN domain
MVMLLTLRSTIWETSADENGESVPGTRSSREVVVQLRVGVYVDGFNLYYGGRSMFGKGTAGWKWLDLRALSVDLVAGRSHWSPATIDRVVFCTALIDTGTNPSGQVDQNIYIRALKASGSVDAVELGYYVTRVKKGALARRTRGPKFEYIDSNGRLIPSGNPPVLVDVAQREEKGSDVNVAAHLLHDCLTNQIDAAIVVSNDSDLAFALNTARAYVPIGTVNPSPNQLAGALRGRPNDGAGNHWWAQLTQQDFSSAQLADPIAEGNRSLRKPQGW